MRPLKSVLLATFLACSATAALASEILISVPGSAKTDTVTASYKCGPHALEVDFINAGDVSIAQMVIDGQLTILANVISGSGAKYAGAQYVLATEGEKEARLWDLMQGGEDGPGITCEYLP